MRAVLHQDVVTLARVMLGVDQSQRMVFCDKIFDKAHAADKYRKRFGRYHVQYGAGSLASACHGEKRENEPFLSNRDYAQCLKVIFERVLCGSNPERM